jgi:pimeloyl-ACP methyl ester carboxylesterase
LRYNASMHTRGFFDWIWHQKLRRPYKLNYATFGTGDKPLLLLHGLASSHQVWRPLIRLVRSDWNIIAPDLLGFGGSPVPNWNEYDVEQHAKHVRALLRRFDVAEPLTIVGHSMGCLVAVHLAHQYPKSVERLVLFEPPLFADVPNYRAHQRVRERYFDIFRYIAMRPQLVFKDGELRKVWARLSGVDLRPHLWLPFQRSLSNTIMNQSAYDELHAIRVPTTIVHGRMDVVVPRADVRKMLRANPYIHFEIVNRTHGVSPRAARELQRLLTDGRIRRPKRAGRISQPTKKSP